MKLRIKLKVFIINNYARDLIKLSA